MGYGTQVSVNFYGPKVLFLQKDNVIQKCKLQNSKRTSEVNSSMKEKTFSW